MNKKKVLRNNPEDLTHKQCPYFLILLILILSQCTLRGGVRRLPIQSDPRRFQRTTGTGFWILSTALLSLQSCAILHFNPLNVSQAIHQSTHIEFIVVGFLPFYNNMIYNYNIMLIKHLNIIQTYPIGKLLRSVNLSKTSPRS